MDIETVMQKLYDSEINCSISCLWDGGWDIKLGDDMNGFMAEGNFPTLMSVRNFWTVKRGFTVLIRSTQWGWSSSKSGRQSD